VLAAGVVMLSAWAPPVMTAGEIDRLPGHGRSSESRLAVAGETTFRSG
jgi:hypothetical protein